MDIREYLQADFQDTYFIQKKEASKIKSLEETLITNQSHGYGNGKIRNMASYMVQRAVFLSLILQMAYFVLMDLEKIMIKLVRKKNIIFL